MKPFKSTRLAYIEDIQDDFKKSFDDLSYLKGITKPFQFTPENMEKLDELWAAGEIESHPIATKSDGEINWIWRNQAGAVDRRGDLPAVTNSSNTSWQWSTNGETHRSHAPAIITIKNGVTTISWYKNGTLIAVHGMTIDGGIESFSCIGGISSSRPTACSKEEYDRIIAGYFPEAKKIYAQDYAEIQDGNVRNASIRRAYVEDLKLPTVKWTIYETGWGTEDMPVGGFATSSFDPQDVAQQVIKHYEDEGAIWDPNGKKMNPQQYILSYLEMDHYDEGRFYTVDFCIPNFDKQKQKVAIYCNGYEEKSEAI